MLLTLINITLINMHGVMNIKNIQESIAFITDVCTGIWCVFLEEGYKLTYRCSYFCEINIAISID
jgi:hypothetical protein